MPTPRPAHEPDAKSLAGAVKGSFIGIDFSGSHGKWKPTVSKPTVWLASVDDGAAPKVEWLHSVQELASGTPPFEWLAGFLRSGRFKGAGIDAPFSVPIEYIPDGGWPGLVTAIGKIAEDGRPFPRADSFLGAIGCQTQRKVLRKTEAFWRGEGINVRSTLWWKPRGGAPFAAACIKLIAAAGLPRCWPWTDPAPGFLVEACPAAQLRKWNLDHQRYNGTDGAPVRGRIVEALKGRIDFGRFEAVVRGSADALDAVLAAFAPMAVWNRTAVMPENATVSDGPIDKEGWIAVHR